MTPENTTVAEQIAVSNEKKKKKKKMIIAILVMALLGGVSWVLLEHPEIFNFLGNRTTSMYSDDIKTFLFYPVDFDIDITADNTYMGLNRYVHYTKGAETHGITDGNYAKYGPVVEFFGVYFSTIINGSTSTYNTYFTDNYYKTNTPYEPFPPQMLYDIHIEELSATENENKTITYAFDVSYKIHKNTGTFRNDIGSDASKVLYYELIQYPNGRILIDRITYYK